MGRQPQSQETKVGAPELASFLASLSPLWPRYDELTESVEEYVLDMLRDQLNRRQPIDNVSRNLLRLLTATCGYKEVRLLAVQRLEMWLQNPKVRCVGETEFMGALLGGLGCRGGVLSGLLASPQLTRPAQDLLMSVCMNCNSHGPEDMDAISHLIKIRLKPKVLLNHYMLCIRCVASWDSGQWGAGEAWPVSPHLIGSCVQGAPECTQGQPGHNHQVCDLQRALQCSQPQQHADSLHCAATQL